MNSLDLVESVKSELGHPVVTLFVTDDQIQVMIKKAIRKCQSKACPTATKKITLNGGKADVSALNVDTVKNIFMDVDSASNNDVFGLGINYPLSTSQGALLDSAVLAGKRAQLEKATLYDYYLDTDDGMLYVDDYSGTVTLEYVKKELELEDLDSEWLGWVEGYVTASAKIIEGRIRGKYRSSSGPFEVESDTLVSEGTSEKSELESRLETSMGYFNIIR